MITRYFDFFKKIFEAKEDDKSLELAESFITKLYKARLLKSNKDNAKKEKLRENPNISSEELNAYLKDIKLTTEQESEIKDIVNSDPFFLRIKDLTKNQKTWFTSFLQLFFQHFKNSNPNLQNDNRIIKQLLGDYTISSSVIEPTTGMSVIKVDWEENGGVIGGIINTLSKEKPDFVSKIFAKLPEISKIQNIQKIDLAKITDDSFRQLVKGILPADTKLETTEDIQIAKELLNTNTFRRPGYEILTDIIRDTKDEDSLNYLINQLPRGVKDKNPEKDRQNLYEEYNKLKDSDKLITDDSEYDLDNENISMSINATKKDLTNLLREFVTLLSSRNIPIERTESKTRKNRYPYENVFKIKLGTVEDKQVDKNLFDFYLRLKSALKAASNSNIENLDKCVAEAKKNFGDDSVEVVWRDQTKPKAVLNITSHGANIYLNGSRGALTPTKLCIAWTDDSYWNKHIENTNSKLYFVYNFELDSVSKLLPIGIAIGPNGKVSSAFDKLDQNGEGEFNVSMTQKQVEKHMRDFGIPYDVLQPLTEEEVQERLFKINAEDLLIKRDISLATLKRILDTGLNPNYRNGQAMINALEENNMEKVKLLIEKGARIDNLGVAKKSAIDYANSLDTLVFLMQSGVKIYKKNEELVDNIITNSIKEPNFLQNIQTVLSLIPKYTITRADIKIAPANDIYERMLALAYDTGNLPFFNTVLEATKKRLLEDFDEPDFLAQFINRKKAKIAKYKQALINTVKVVYADDPEYVEELIQKINSK